MNLRYVQATESDIPVIFAQAKELIDHYEDLSCIDYDKVLKWVNNKITHEITTYRCVLLDGKPAAYYRLCRDGELDDLYVLPRYRNRGIGSEIMKKCLEESEKPLYLYVFTLNKRAISFYERFDFSVRETVGTTRLIMARSG